MEFTNLPNDKIYKELLKTIKFGHLGIIADIGDAIQKLGYEYLISPNYLKHFSSKYPRWLILCTLCSGEGHPLFNNLRQFLLEIGIIFSSFDLLYMFIIGKYWRYIYEPEIKNLFLEQLIESPEFAKLLEFPYSSKIEELVEDIKPDIYYFSKVAKYWKRTGICKIKCFFFDTPEFIELDSASNYWDYGEIRLDHKQLFPLLSEASIDWKDPNTFSVNPNSWTCLSVIFSSDYNMGPYYYFIRDEVVMQKRIEYIRDSGFSTSIFLSELSPENVDILVQNKFLPFL